MGVSGIFKSTVSKLCRDIAERVNEFLDRPLTGDRPYLRLDATYPETRQRGRIVAGAAILAVAAKRDGQIDRRSRAWAIRGRDLLGGLPAWPQGPIAGRHQAGHFRRTSRP